MAPQGSKSPDKILLSACDRSRQAEWTKSGDMVVDDSEAEQEVLWECGLCPLIFESAQPSLDLCLCVCVAPALA